MPRARKQLTYPTCHRKGSPGHPDIPAEQHRTGQRGGLESCSARMTPACPAANPEVPTPRNSCRSRQLQAFTKTLAGLMQTPWCTQTHFSTFRRQNCRIQTKKSVNAKNNWLTPSQGALKLNLLLRELYSSKILKPRTMYFYRKSCLNLKKKCFY